MVGKYSILNFGDVIQLMIHSSHPAGLEQCLHQNRMHENEPPGLNNGITSYGSFPKQLFLGNGMSCCLMFKNLIFGAGHYDLPM